MAETFAPRCLSLDLEVGKDNGRLYHIAAVRGDTGAAIAFRKDELAAGLQQLDDFAARATFLLGHNLLAFDLPHLTAVKPDLRLLQLPAVDTLCLNPLAFPRNPYHHLVKHYQDAQLSRGRLNDPELDARLTLTLFSDQRDAFLALCETAPDLLTAWHWLTTRAGAVVGFDSLFWNFRKAPCPSETEAHAAIQRCLGSKACLTQSRALLAVAHQHGWALAYTLAWLSVAGGNSVMPPWVRHQFPNAGRLVRLLRDTPCSDPSCAWCRERHDAQKELTRWFGFPGFRAEPVGEDGRPLQQAIVEAAMRGEHVLGILPTGTGKSLCYQIPALSRYDKTGALTVVISPLVALMADQVAGLEARGITTCTAINGLLSMPERSNALDRVRLGDVGILIISPEQLRSRSVRKVLTQREIGAWVLDEAHCISKWGHDFRPDYRYVGRVIKELAGTGTAPPVLCLTATAKPDVIVDILGYFHEKVGIDLTTFNGGASRTNLDFVVVQTSASEKFDHVYQLLEIDLPPDTTGGAIVYCATRAQTERMAAFLREKGFAAAHFHAGLPPETKKDTQGRFIRGELRVIVATNAFGMGIDKPDVRLVLHADIPGSLENYLQEAGRAGRDQQAARCVLLYTPDDVERQFSMSARSRLTQQEIQAILKSLRNLDRKKLRDGEVVATTGEILLEEEDKEFQRDSATDDTRVRTAIAWLEESALLTREENQVQVYPSSLRVSSREEARQRLDKAPLPAAYTDQLLKIVEALLDANATEGISTDELMGISGLSPEKIRAAFSDLEQLGIASNDTALTAYLHAGVERSSQKRLEDAVALETALLDELRQAAPDMEIDEPTSLHLRIAAQHLQDAGHTTAVPERLWRIVKSLASDGQGEDNGLGSVRLKRIDGETIQVTLQRDWHMLLLGAQLRRDAAGVLLTHLLSCLPTGARGLDLLAETTLGQLLAALNGDLTLRAATKHPNKMLDRALLWLHEQEVLRLNKGLAVFRPAMTIHLSPDRRNFIKPDFTPLKMHYDEQVVQIHVMAEYVQRGLQAMADALRLAMDYFSLDRAEFLRRWLPDREKELERQTTPESWKKIVEALNHPIQQRIVADDREQTNVLVLAGPGSGKTRVLVHRIAYLVRVKREQPQRILALAYNRHAAVEIRRRLHALIGDDAYGVTVLTCHALAMRLTGVTFAQRAEKVDTDAFKAVFAQAVALLNGTGLPPEEADAQRDRLLAGFRWILVDEYQDIGPEQYALISALAGRTRQDDDGKLCLFAVGDDDQNIYAFNNASVEFIRRFEADYAARPVYLTENYRSTAHVIDVANAIIAPARNRMKIEHPITINRGRVKASRGGSWQQLDAVGQGRVQILPAGSDPLTQALAVMTEFQRLAQTSPTWTWATAAVIAREWKYLEPLRCYCERQGIPVQMADEDTSYFWRLRETQALVGWVRARERKLVDAATLANWLADGPDTPWVALLREAVATYALETGGAELPREHFTDWLAEWGREIRRRQTGLLLLTAHRAKGLEFDHVAVLDGGWQAGNSGTDPDEHRRLYYVAMTRAQHTLTLARFDTGHALLDPLPTLPGLLRRPRVELPPPAPELAHRYQRLALRDVDLGFAGRRESSHPLHCAIAALHTGDPLQLGHVAGRWELRNQQGEIVGRLARAYEPPRDRHCRAAKVAAIIVWRREDDDAEYQDRTQVERWEVVVPEFVFG